MHIVFVIANESSVPYFRWFADESLKHEDLTFSFVALYHRRPDMLDEMAERGLDAYWIPFDPRHRRVGMVRCFFKLYRLFSHLRPDVVHTHLFDDSVPGLLAARLAGIKTRVITKQDATYHWYHAPRWVPFDRLNNHNATVIHSVASENRRFVIESERAPERKVRLVRNGFPYDVVTASNPGDIASLQQQYSLQGRRVVGTVARYIPWKGHHLIIQAAKKLIEQAPDLLFIWAGSDGGSGYKQQLQDLIAASDLTEHVRLLGWVEREQMPSLYRCMDIYLHPALREPFGFAIAEALMNQVPIVATQTGATDLIEHLVNGYILRQGDADDIVTAVSSLLHRPDERLRMAARGHQHALEHLTFEGMWQGHLAMYRS